ncbi:MAG TPA: hypothetical protein VFW40_03065, partial [Capsulimonadaceae bacterium]|nr:hypothetical protein [Capsulimonadaceae bacterium]
MQTRAQHFRLLIVFPLVLVAFIPISFDPASGSAAHRPGKVDHGADETTVVKWIGSLQYLNPTLPSFGAIQIDPGPGYRAPGGAAYYRVSPYDANLAALGLLSAHASSSQQIAERWIVWYLSHAGQHGAAPGEIYDYWYLKDGGGETTSPQGIGPDRQNDIDAADSAAATFLRCVWADVQAGGRASLAETPDLKSRLEEIAGVVLSLQQPDGLTWAKRPYHVEYAMDNSEVFLGLRSMARLETALFKDRAASARYEGAAERVRLALLHTLYDPKNHLFAVARLESGKLQPAK